MSLPLPPPRRAPTNPFSKCEREFFARGEAMADQPAPPIDDFRDLEGDQRPSFWRRLFRIARP